MHLSGDAKDLLYKYTILIAMMRRLTRFLFGHTFRKLTFKVNKSQKTLLCEARNVPNVQADLSLRHSHVLKVSLLLVHVQPISIQTIGLCDQIHFVDS